ncbi:hypothetical protein RhiirA4_487337 [Rhizophagus irregularis]|uniref:Uncharacterized protein n=1 Tax=Rhizophagus irregularis TaxID=588596 RepID=A0A2I1HSG9_9GLOM|nr:hypothetical protein RhiirA4_487337 [Rhizophagus irregularis]
MTTIRNYHNQITLKDEDRDMIKLQRNYLIKMYENTMDDLNILSKMADRIRERWLKLQGKPKPLSRIDQFKERCMENEIQTYELKYDEIDLDSDYENSEDETPIESEDGEDSDETLSDNESEKEERAMSPTPYPCCNEIHCICYDQIEIDKEYEEYCLNQVEQMAENY